MSAPDAASARPDRETRVLSLHNHEPKLPGIDRFYRVCVFGATGSGKTCLLAAMGTAQDLPVSERRTCVRHPRVHETFRAWTVEELRAAAPDDYRRDASYAFSAGDLEISRAEGDLSRGELPKSTDTSRLLLTAFDITSPGRGKTQLELIDFAGELLRAAGTGHDVARLLKAYLDASDALVVLTEAPPPGAEHSSHIGHDVDTLLTAFQSHMQGKGESAKTATPVALLLTKFDRREPAPTTEGDCQAAVDRLRAASQAVSRVYDTLNNSCQHFAAFPGSAFQQGPDGLAPAAGQRLEAYGILPAILWACDRKDEIDETELPRPDRIAWVSPWKWGEHQRRRDAAQLLAAKKNVGPDHVRLVTLSRRYWWLAWVNGVSAVLGVVVLAMMLLSAVNYSLARNDLARAERAILDPSTSPDEMQAQRTHVADMAAPRWWRPFFEVPRAWFGLGDRRRVAVEVADAASSRRRDVALKAMRDADDEAFPGLFEEYKRRYETDEVLAELSARAEAIASRKRRTEGEKENARWLEQTKTDADIAIKARKPASLQEMARSLRFPQPVYPSLEQTQTLGELIRRLNEAAVEATEAGVEKEERARLAGIGNDTRKSLQNSEFDAACLSLARARIGGWQSKSVKAGADEFEKQFPSDLEAAVAREAKKAADIEYWRSFHDAAIRLAARPEYVEAVPQQMRNRIADIHLAARKQQDFYLYERFRKQPDQRTAEVYLREALHHSMDQQVKDFLEWHGKMNSDQPLQFGISEVEWHDWYSRSTQVQILVKDEVVFDQTFEPTGKGTTSKHSAMSSEVLRTPTGKYKVEVIFTMNGNDNLSAQLKGAWRFPDEPLNRLDNMQQELGGENARGVKARLRIRGIPRRPAIDAWKE